MFYKIDTTKVQSVKGELQPKLSLLHMKVITLIKAKNNVVMSQRQTQSKMAAP